MSTIVNLVQGTTEWHEHRRVHRIASETPAVLGVSPWTTPYQLWQQKLGLAKPEVNAAMLRGTELEPAARAAYERLTGVAMKPLVLVDGDYSASLDGLTLAGDRILEIKVPMKGRDSSLWKSIEARALPEHYQHQVQHQLMVTKGKRPRNPLLADRDARRAEYAIELGLSGGGASRVVPPRLQAVAGFQWKGSSSARRWRGCAGNRCSTSLRYA